MKVMTNHEWWDDDVESILKYGNENIREIEFRANVEEFLITKKDAIALAKEFGLVVYERDSAL